MKITLGPKMLKGDFEFISGLILKYNADAKLNRICMTIYISDNV